MLEDHEHSKCIHDEIDDRYTRNVQGFQFNSYDGYDCYNIDEYAIYLNYMLLLFMMKLLLVHAVISMVQTKTMHSVKMVFGMVQVSMNTCMTISALVITSMANVKVKRKKAVAMTVLLMEPLTVSI